MAKLNQLTVSVVLKVKQMQHLEGDKSAMDKWREVREKELKERGSQIGMDGEELTDEQKMALMEEEDDRGYFLPTDLRNATLFTRTQLLQLINRKRELDEE